MRTPQIVYLGTFPRDERLEAFVSDLRQIVKGTGCIWQRGRGPRKAPALACGYGPRGFDQSIPLQYSTHVALYFRPAERLYKLSRHIRG